MTDMSRMDASPSQRRTPARRRAPVVATATRIATVSSLLAALLLCGCGNAGPAVGSHPLDLVEDAELAEVRDTGADEVDALDPAGIMRAQAVEQAEGELGAAVAAIEASGADISYIAIGLDGGRTIEHNADRAYYSASTIKAPFCISLVRAQGDAARASYGGLITSTIVNSDNEAYRTLRERLYGQSFFGELSAQAGAPCDLTHWYCDYSVRDLANIWRVCADWLSTDDPCAQWLRDMLGDTLNSRVDDIAGGEQTATWSKAGWFSGEARYNVTFDGGVVNTPRGSYAIAVATDRGSDFKSIESVMGPLVSLVDAEFDEP